MILYTPFWKTLKSKNITQYRLINEFGISAGQLSRMRKNQYISTHTVDVLCEILECEVQDIMEYKRKKYECKDDNLNN